MIRRIVIAASIAAMMLVGTPAVGSAAPAADPCIYVMGMRHCF